MVRRSVIALVTAEVISSPGTLMAVVALPWFVLETTGSPRRMTVVLAAGPLLDRFGAAPVFAGVAAAQTAAVIVVGRVALRGPPAPVAVVQRST